LIGNYLPKIGRKNSIMIGGIFLSAITISFGLLNHIKNDNLFFAIALVLNFFAGIMDTLITVAAYSITSYEFLKNTE